MAGTLCCLSILNNHITFLQLFYYVLCIEQDYAVVVGLVFLFNTSFSKAAERYEIACHRCGGAFLSLPSQYAKEFVQFRTAHLARMSLALGYYAARLKAVLTRDV